MVHFKNLEISPVPGWDISRKASIALEIQELKCHFALAGQFGGTIIKTPFGQSKEV
jgi:hypothetical protein